MKKRSQGAVFIDAFAGCGGLSLGLIQAGLRGKFAIEKDEFAFKTLKRNLIDASMVAPFEWPNWLPQAPISVEDLIEHFGPNLRSMKGNIDVLAGGPPCQGFSAAGRRKANDPRNRLFKSYIDLVRLIEPKIVLMENVRGFTVGFGENAKIENYASELRALLRDRYVVHECLIDLSAFGVPQQRTRYFLIAVHSSFGDVEPFKMIEDRLQGFLLGLGIQTPVSAWSAISDLEVNRGGVTASRDTNGFSEIIPSRRRSRYQKLMGTGAKTISDLRLARHSARIQKRFGEIIETCQALGRLNISVGSEIRERYGLKKQALRVLDPDRPSPTITSMPDDLLHYAEARTLTVRENARLQSFPDWFQFEGKYTTGGDRRQREVPRFTQVANAVPPLAAEAIGGVLLDILNGHTSSTEGSQNSGPLSERPVQELKLAS